MTSTADRAAAEGLQGRIVWCDAEANLFALDSREKVAELADRCKEVNINTIVVDVKPISGEVLYKSRIAPRLKEWDGKPYPEDYDLLRVMVEEGHRVGIDVYTGINVFSEGVAGRDPSCFDRLSMRSGCGAAIAHPDWQCVKYEVGSDGRPKFVRVGQAADEHLAIFVNPANPEVRSYELTIIHEILANYNVDGIVFDRMRYPGIYADFSDLSRSAFETWLGEKVERFPEDIFTISPYTGQIAKQGKYFANWMEWRAWQIREFLAEARQVVKSAKPSAKVAVYVGSWYSSYYDVGVNWASPSFDPPYDWALPSYRRTGYADLVDWMCTGCYYQYPTRWEAKAAGASEHESVEAAGQESIQAVNDEAFVYGSLYLLQYKDDPKTFERAIAASLAATQGVMLFDLVYIREYDWWDILKRVFAAPAKAPHTMSRQEKS